MPDNYKLKKISRSVVYKTIEQCWLNFSSKEHLHSLIGEDSDDNDLADEISIRYSGVSNGYLSDIYEVITDDKVEVIGKADSLFKCPCCGLRTLTELYDVDKGTGYDICDYCRWEDDGTTSLHAQSSVNKGSIADYRSKIKSNPDVYFREKYYK